MPDPWFGGPTIITGPDGQPMLAEVSTCTGYVISGGWLAHARPCPMHPEARLDPPATQDGAETDGGQ